MSWRLIRVYEWTLRKNLTNNHKVRIEGMIATSFFASMLLVILPRPNDLRSSAGRWQDFQPVFLRNLNDLWDVLLFLRTHSADIFEETFKA